MKSTSLTIKSFSHLILLSLVLFLAACQPAASTATLPTAPPTSIPQTAPSAVPSVAPSPTTLPAKAVDLPPTLPAAQPTASQPSALTVHSIEMFDPSTGWGSTETAVYRTTDGGHSWQDLTPGEVSGQSNPVQTVFFNPQTAWIILPDAQKPDQGVLYRTGDGGQSWQSAPVPFSMGRAQLLGDGLHGFYLASRGVAAGSEAVDLFATQDGGAAWTLVYHLDPSKPNEPDGIPFAGTKNGFSFLDPQHGWMGGFEPAQGFSYLYATADGGKTWKQVKLSVPQGLEQAQISVQPPRFFNDRDGVLVAVYFLQAANQVFYVTHDAGATWTPGAPLESPNGAVAVATVNDFIVWDGGTLNYTHDSGATWQSLTPNVNLSQMLSSLDFVDAQNGWAVSTDANGIYKLYRTRDGGATWQNP